MKTYLLEPRDPLVVRDGRPLVAGMPQMRSLDFPLPSTLAGFVRSRAGAGADGRFDPGRIEEVLQRQVRGPWLMKLDDRGKPVESYWPAPRDGVWFPTDEGKDTRWRALRPHDAPDDVQHDLLEGLELVGFEGRPPKGKPAEGEATFWSWDALEAWLVERREPRAGGGLRGLTHERRMHVALDPVTQTAIDGALFATDGLRFWNRDRESSRLALAFETDADPGSGLATFGGERRMAFVCPADQGLPGAPAKLASKLDARARLILVTPGCFDTGAVPRTLHGREVVAACVGRPDVVSGWDMRNNAPKPTRRLAPAGSVYWVDLPANAVDRDVWLRSAWAAPAPEQSEQDRRDGFGLIFVGVA